MLGIHTPVHIVGEDDCEVFLAMCRIVGVTPAALISRIVAREIAAHRADPRIIESIRFDRFLTSNRKNGDEVSL